MSLAETAMKPGGNGVRKSKHPKNSNGPKARGAGVVKSHATRAVVEASIREWMSGVGRLSATQETVSAQRTMIRIRPTEAAAARKGTAKPSKAQPAQLPPSPPPRYDLDRPDPQPAETFQPKISSFKQHDSNIIRIQQSASSTSRTSIFTGGRGQRVTRINRLPMDPGEGIPAPEDRPMASIEPGAAAQRPLAYFSEGGREYIRLQLVGAGACSG
jgi:hypothetical protein